MHSRDGSDERMPSWPMAIPSVTVMVQNSRGVPPAEATPFLTAWAWRISEMLQGAASFQHEATPTNGWWICWLVSPMAYRYERWGARSGPSVTCRLGNRFLMLVLASIANLFPQLHTSVSRKPEFPITFANEAAIFSYTYDVTEGCG